MSTLSQRIGIIGGGNMGEAFIGALINTGMADAEQISVKAKSGEGVGPVGRGEAIEAEVVVLIERKTDE